MLLFDVDAIFQGFMPEGLVGWEWMLDHCHLAPQAYDVLRADLVRAIAGRWD